MASFPLKNVANQKKYYIESCAITNIVPPSPASFPITMVQDGNILTIAWPEIVSAGNNNTHATAVVALTPGFNLVNSTAKLIPGINNSAAATLEVVLSGASLTSALTFSVFAGTNFNSGVTIHAGQISAVLAQANLS